MLVAHPKSKPKSSTFEIPKDFDDSYIDAEDITRLRKDWNGKNGLNVVVDNQCLADVEWKVEQIRD